MVNKRSLWFLTLFSLILVLSVYYITMPSELLMDTNTKIKKEEKIVSKVKEEDAELVALRVESEEKMLDKITELKKILTDSKSTTEEKNEAFEKLQNLNKNKGLEEKIQNKIEKEFKYKSFVCIDEDKVEVVIDTKDHSSSLANKIMRLVQSNFDTHMNISVKFKS